MSTKIEWKEIKKFKEPIVRKHVSSRVEKLIPSKCFN